MWYFPGLSHSDRRWLNRAVSEVEILVAVNEMGALKAPGPDGFPPLFFQRFWPLVGSKVVVAVQRMFLTGSVPAHLNESIICLIPKEQCLKHLSQFRPISLCNVLLKVVTKVLANRLKSVMPKLTGPQQSSFIAGRSTLDNITVAQEMIHSLTRRKGNKGGLILKVDLEKAYDRVDWGFLDEVLSITGFNATLIQLIRSCTTSASLSVSWNGALLDPFTPSRGLRQGNPLSPYLFVLCMEVLSQRISQAVATGQWAALTPSRGGPAISHVFFADDLLLFGAASFSQARVMDHVLADFCAILGQSISRNKSTVWFSPNTPVYLQHSICSAFHIPSTRNLGTYLGIPLIHGRTRVAHFRYILDKAHRRLAGWKIKSLSRAARLVLIKSTLAALPLYSMQVFKLPASIVQHLTRLCRNFFWGSTAEHHTLHTIAWSKICRARQFGGLGIFPLKAMNSALLAKRVWKVALDQGELSTSVLRAKYGGWPTLVRGIPKPGSSII